MNNKEKFLNAARYMVLAGVIVLAVIKFSGITAFLTHMNNVAMPLLLGMVIAYALNILVRKLEKIYFPKTENKWINRSRRGVCIFLSIFIIIGIISIVTVLVVPELIKAITMMVESAPASLTKAQKFFNDLLQKYPAIEDSFASMKIDISSMLQSVMNTLSAILNGFINSTFSFVSALTSGVMNFVIGLIFAIYILFNKEKLSIQFKRILKAFCKSRTVNRVMYIVDTANVTFSNFIVGQCVEAVILGSLCTIGMLILGFPYAPMVGAFIGATALIPVVGAYLGAGLGAFMIITINPMKALFFILFIVVLQQIEGNLIYPRVVGSSVGLPGIWVLAAVTLGGGLGGIFGMLIAVPIAATAYRLLREKVRNKLMFDSDYCHVEYKEKENVVLLTWKKESHGEHYRKPTTFALELVRKYDNCNFVCDARNGFEDTVEDTEWVKTVFLPELSKAGCKQVVFIMNEVNDIEEEMDMWTAEFCKYFTVHKVTDFEDVPGVLAKSEKQ